MANETFDSVWDALSDTEEQAQNMKLRSELMTSIKAVITKRGWTQVHAAHELGITQPRVSDLTRGRIHKFSLDALVAMATHIGLRVEIAAVDTSTIVSPPVDSNKRKYKKERGGIEASQG